MAKYKLPKVSVPKVKINKSKSLKVIVITVGIAALVLLISAVGHHWQVQKQKENARVVAVQKAEDQKKLDEKNKLDHANKVEVAYTTLYTECTKGQNIYDNVLTPAQRKVNLKSQPVCGAAVPAR